MEANDMGVFGKLPITLWVSHTHNTVPLGRLARQGGLTHTLAHRGSSVWLGKMKTFIYQRGLASA